MQALQIRCSLGEIPHISVQYDNQTHDCVADEIRADQNGEHGSDPNLCWIWIRVERHDNSDLLHDK